jgi:hypothetical protein
MMMNCGDIDGQKTRRLTTERQAHSSQEEKGEEWKAIRLA